MNRTSCFSCHHVLKEGGENHRGQQTRAVGTQLRFTISLFSVSKSFLVGKQQRGGKDPPMMPPGPGCDHGVAPSRAGAPSKNVWLQLTPNKSYTPQMKQSVGLGTWIEACSHLTLPCASWPSLESSSLEDAKGSNQNQSQTQSHSASKKTPGWESNNTSLENYFRLNSSPGHDLQG